MLYPARQSRFFPALLLAFLCFSLLFAGGARCVRAQGGPISSGQSLSGTLTTSSGRSVARGASYYADRYTFTASAGQIVTLSTTSSLDSYGYVYNPAGTQVASDDDSNGGGNFKIGEIRIGESRVDQSYARVEVSAPTGQALDDLLLRLRLSPLPTARPRRDCRPPAATAALR